MRPSRPLAHLLVAGALVGCGEAPEEGPRLPWPRTPFPTIVEHEVPEVAALGRLLFYDPLLSSDGEVACATCHSEEWGMSDGLPVSVGVLGVGTTGPGRDGPNKTTRNAPSLFNAALRPALFWDGRARSLTEQVRSPIDSEVELDRTMAGALAALEAVPAYRELFDEAFGLAGAPIEESHLARALAAFERSFVSNLSPYDRFAAGDEGALDERQVRGMWVLAEQGCTDCHAPPLFESNRYANWGIGDGSDEGRAAVTGDPADRGAFRTPTLRNVAESGPYFHDGSEASLEDAVRLKLARRDVPGAPPASDDDIAALVRFLKQGLIDRSRAPFRPKTVPSGLDVPIDGYRFP